MPDSANHSFAAALVAALADLGLREVCLSPGSRNTPLTLAFAAHPGIRSWIHHDERSAGFFALGLARASARPVAVVCTSGTAATQYFAAITEAAQSRVPLIVLTADRPPELRDVGAPQAIDQIHLYGGKVKWFHQGAPPDAHAVRHAPHLAAHAWGAAVEIPPGAVHLNLPFREPLVGSAEPESPRQPTPAVHVGRPAPDEATAASVAAALDGQRTLFVIGAATAGSAAALANLARTGGAVVFADPQSGLRGGPTFDVAVPHADLLAAAGALDGHPPDVVVRWGALPTSKAVWRWLENHPEIPQILVDPSAHREPLGTSRVVVRCDPAVTAAALPPFAAGPPEWTATWRTLGESASNAVDRVLADEPFPNEPAVASQVVAAVPPGGALFAGSSMPIRDIDAFARPRMDPLTLFANRGANGIDGSIATPAGMAATDTPTVALIGDVAALHDIGSLAMVKRLALPLTVVIVHNDGGGIFGLLPQADPALVDAALYERTFGTPHGTDFAAVAIALGLPAIEVTSADALADAIGAAADGPQLVQVRTRRSNIAPLRRKVVESIRAAIR